MKISQGVAFQALATETAHKACCQRKTPPGMTREGFLTLVLVGLIPHSPDEHMSCQGARIDSDIGISSLCRWIEGSYGAPSG